MSAEEGTAAAPVEEQKEEQVAAAEAQAEETKTEASAQCDKECCCECECPCKMLCEPFEKSEFFGEMKKLFMWDNVMQSLLAFAVMNVFFLLILYFKFSVFGLVCWVLFFALLAALAYDFQHVLGYFQKKEVPSRFAENKCEVPAKYIDGFFTLVASIVNAFLGVALNAIKIRCVPFSLAMIGVFLVLIFLAGHVCCFCTLYIALLFCFVWFRLYRDQKNAIDELFAKAKNFAKQQIELVKEKINKPKTN